MRVLLATTTTPDDRKTLACARALADAGARVTVGGDSFWGQAFYSRSVQQRRRYPHPRYGILPFIEAINQHIERDDYDVVLPMNDYTTIALTQGRDVLSPAVATALPPAVSLDTASDKSQTVALANRLDVSTPGTFEVATDSHLREVADRVDFPCVSKLRRGSGAVGYRLIASRQELLNINKVLTGRSDMAFDREHVLIQEYVPGEIHDVCVLCEHGQVRAGLTQKRLRSYPKEGGVGTLVETTHQPELLNQSQRVLEALDWHGPAQVEFKLEPETGRTWLIEINGRFWGSIGVAVEAGIDFPLLACKLAMGEDVGPVAGYALGLRYRFPFPFGLLALTEGTSRRQAVQDFFAPRRDTSSDVVWSDPLPLMAESLLIARRAWQRRSLRPQTERL